MSKLVQQLSKKRAALLAAAARIETALAVLAENGTVIDEERPGKMPKRNGTVAERLVATLQEAKHGMGASDLGRKLGISGAHARSTMQRLHHTFKLVHPKTGEQRGKAVWELV